MFLDQCVGCENQISPAAAMDVETVSVQTLHAAFSLQLIGSKKPHRRDNLDHVKQELNTEKDYLQKYLININKSQSSIRDALSFKIISQCLSNC